MIWPKKKKKSPLSDKFDLIRQEEGAKYGKAAWR